MIAVKVLAACSFAAAWLLGLADPAGAHAGDEAGPTNYETVVEEVRPAIEGLRVRSVDLSSQMELRNRTGETVTILGYEGEPYLRVDDRGTWMNTRSPAAYLNSTRDGGTEVPPEADADAKPRWEKVSGGTTARWHDHRAHWMATDDPPAVRAEPDRRHVVIPDWEIPFRIGDSRGLISGDLTWSPGPSPLPLWLLALGLGAAVAAAAIRFVRRRSIIVAVTAVAAAAASLLQTVGFAAAPDMSGTPVARFLAEGGLILAIGWLGGAVAAWWLLVKRDPEGIVVAGVAGLTVFIGAGIGESRLLARAHLGTALTPPLARGLVIACIGLGGALCVAAVAAVRPRFLDRLVRR